MKSFTENSLVKLKDNEWFDKQKIAGQCVARCLQTSKELIEAHTTNLSLKQIEDECLKIMLSMKCTPTFLGYKGFPGAICTSVNTQLVHGIPSNYILQDGDVVKVDLGATYEGVIADAAITTIYGPPKDKLHIELIDTCRKALDNAIAMVSVGKRLGVIGAAIHYTNKSTRFGLITEYGGHGIDMNTPHAPPFVKNKSTSQEGIRIQPGLSIAIEPMLVIGDPKTQVSSIDNWTVSTPGIGAHFEHSIFVGKDQVHIMTKLDQ